VSRIAGRTALVTGATSGIGRAFDVNVKAPFFLTGAALEALAATIPAGHAADAEQIASVVVFLASEDADFIYGAVVHADGGRVAV
jgi:3-oxoacyl-[acyl-carrier protein] reductase